MEMENYSYCNAHMTCAVVLATYNGENFIREQLESIISQSRSPDNIVITDDGSTDNTLDICKEVLKESKIRYSIITNLGSKGVANNFFNGINYCSENVVFFSDQDDIWLNEKIKIVMEVFENNADCVLVLSDGYIWNYTNRHVYNSIFQSLGLNDLYDENGRYYKDIYWKTLIVKNFATGMCMAIKGELGNIQKRNLKIYHDTWYNIICSSMGAVYFVSRPLVYYRQHMTNVQGMKKRKMSLHIKYNYQHNYQSILKEKEKLNIIEQIQKEKDFLNAENTELLKRKQTFIMKREEYITNNNVFKLIKTILKDRNFEFYHSFIFIMRDICLCLLHGDKI